MHQYNVGCLFERIAIDVADQFAESDNWNKCIVIMMDYFSKWTEKHNMLFSPLSVHTALPNQEAATVAGIKKAAASVSHWIYTQIKDEILSQHCLYS